MSRVLPILFNTEMVRAILDGRKTVTRRLIKKSQCDGLRKCKIEPTDWDLECLKEPWRSMTYAEFIKSSYAPPYKPGDILYVRETWRVGAWDIRNQMIAFDYKDGTCGELTYIHDRELFERLVNQSREDARKAKCEYNGVDFVWEKGKSPCRWHPSIHMPKEAARIWLKVKDVRVERLQDMDEDDAFAEGISPWDDRCYANNGWKPTFYDPDSGGACCPLDAFEDTWNSTIKKSDLNRYGWDANPWVWVIEFERCDKPENF